MCREVLISFEASCIALFNNNYSCICNSKMCLRSFVANSCIIMCRGPRGSLHWFTRLKKHLLCVVTFGQYLTIQYIQWQTILWEKSCFVYFYRLQLYIQFKRCKSKLYQLCFLYLAKIFLNKQPDIRFMSCM